VTVTAADGSFQLPALPPGEYTVTFTLDGMQTVTRKAMVQLSDITVVEAALGIKGVTEAVTVTAEAALIDKTSAAITSGISSQQINSVPVGQEYRDLIKLIPGVQYSQDTTRGPSAGSNGQDNVYSFDGVNVTLPLFGTLSAEPAAHDIAQMTIIKGGAKAVDFQRAGGFAVDSVSKSGTNRYSGQLSWQVQNPAMAAALNNGSASRYEQTRTWTDLNAGGPIIADRLFFFGSYYRPQNSRDNRSNLYGELPDYTSVRNEGFGKLTVTPTHSTLLNVSLRDEHRLDKSNLFTSTQSPTSGSGNEASLRIGTADGSWIINAMSYATFKWTHFANKTQSRPDNIASVSPTTAIGTHLDITSLGR
jgi:carboxypeptidase family protein